MADKPKLSESAGKALKQFDETLGFHQSLCERIRRNHDAYLGVLEINSKADQWPHSKLHPPYLQNILETAVAALADDKLSFRIRPRPKFYEPWEWELAKEGARAHEILHGYQLDRDRFQEKQRPFVLENLKSGYAVVKNYWKTDHRTVRKLGVVDTGARDYGIAGIEQLFEYVEVESNELLFDGPTTEVVNPNDFCWHEAAVDIQRSPVVWHRVWLHINELRELERQGVYKNVSQLGETRDFTNEHSEGDRSRTKDMVEVLEIWRLEPQGIRVVTLGNRKVELREDRANPFWHGEYPFVVSSIQSIPFKIEGISMAGKLSHLQEAIWDLMNQRHMNVAILNNFIAVIRSDVQDPDAFTWEPGARWEVESEGAIEQLPVDPTVSQVSMPAEALLKQDMQNLSQSQPFTSTSEASRIGADTATEAALVTNLAQRATIAMKTNLNQAYQRIGQQRTELNKQFLRSNIAVHRVGLDNEPEQVEIAPYLLQGGFDFDITPMNESLMRAERRAEANAMLTTMAQIVPLIAALAQGGNATMLNMDEFVRLWLENSDVGPPERFFSQAAPAVAPGNPTQMGTPDPFTGGGVTAPQATDPLTSPSAQASLSGETMMQRNLARRGGAFNV